MANMSDLDSIVCVNWQPYSISGWVDTFDVINVFIPHDDKYVAISKQSKRPRRETDKVAVVDAKSMFITESMILNYC